MRPADRLFQIILLLRHGRVVTAAALAQALAVSERTILQI
jgi:predicted DNA-binding transcriptional regulator YafY